MKEYLSIIEKAFAKDIEACAKPSDAKEWARLGFHIAYHLYPQVRSWRYKIEQVKRARKEDGSPATTMEVEMEELARTKLKLFFPEAVFCGEELGGEPLRNDYLLVIDPIDGTRNFLSGFGTYSITLGILKGSVPLFSLICAPVSGEIYFRIGKEGSYLLSMPEKGESPELHPLPLFAPTADKPILVNLHPARKSLPYLECLFEWWRQGEISLLKSVSGSPSLLMVEAAKTGTFYINTWDDAPARPYDLIPALHIIRASHSRALRKDGREVDAWDHQGLFILGPPGKKLDALMNRLAALDGA